MAARTAGLVAYAIIATAFLASPGLGEPATLALEKGRLEAALLNLTSLKRPGEDGYATVWDGNKYVQCRRMPDDAWHCEAAGALMQPSLGRVLSPERVARLVALGWTVDPAFGNFVQVFPAGMTESRLADRILQALAEGYGANLDDLGLRTDWVRAEPCPPRNGPSQNLAGMINDDPAMAAMAVFDCAYRLPPDDSPFPAASGPADLIDIYGPRVTGEIQRIRVNIDRWVYVILETGAGYVQCGSESTPPAIYCEVQSADSWPVLERILTPDRIARLHAAGFADPGRAPNYSKTYAVEAFSDAAIAEELLTILYDAYNYTGVPRLTFATEKGRD